MTTRYVRYVGPVHRRVITESDWKGARLQGTTVVWEASNGFAVPLDQFTDEQIKKAIEKDSNFTITGEDEDFEPQPAPYDMTPREHRQSIENPVDVPAILEGVATGSVDLSEVPSVPASSAPNGGESTDNRAELLKDTGADNEPTDADYAPDGGNLPVTGRS